jgi:hypothetical protein
MVWSVYKGNETEEDVMLVEKGSARCNDDGSSGDACCDDGVGDVAWG